MDYEKKYKEALERTRKLKENPQSVFNEYSPKEGDTICDYIFPELKESEDEKIRKELITHCRNTRCVTEEGAERIAKWIDWFEKQDPKKHEEEIEKAYKTADEVQYKRGYEDAVKEMEKQGEQKPDDKVEPKFKVGDWVVVSTTKGDRVVQIAYVEYFKDGYPSYITTEGRWFGNETKARLLTDKDVETITLPESKVIVHQKPAEWSEENEEYNGEDYGIDGLWHAMNILEKTLGKVNGYQTDDGFLSHQCAITAVKKLYKQKPTETAKWSAQEEYCICELEAMVKEAWRKAENVRNDITIKKMQELMFFLKTLNPNKKPQRIISAEAKEALYDKPAWSEEDEKMCQETIDWFEKKCFPCALENDNPARKSIKWLKSLKDRYTWKPNDKQMLVLELASKYDRVFAPEQIDILIDLKNQLKKLKGE